MDRSYIEKMVRKCFLQYSYERDSMPLSGEDLEKIFGKIEKTRGEDPGADLIDIINDAVYEYLSNQGRSRHLGRCRLSRLPKNSIAKL
ncbi:YqzH family protein [Mesobacillus zeae]|uniref:YqzH-like protein n=1 Tax=Mesobacillus zeae TaxID=1917180 RepID=A0A398B8C4_9BACI|nr:YqzH family protein [Mesobacillus zeae]RID83963.1 hypothetical protein D1970_15330 [Mesobacillus zeae]